MRINTKMVLTQNRSLATEVALKIILKGTTEVGNEVVIDPGEVGLKTEVGIEMTSRETSSTMIRITRLKTHSISKRKQNPGVERTEVAAHSKGEEARITKRLKPRARLDCTINSSTIDGRLK